MQFCRARRSRIGRHIFCWNVDSMVFLMFSISISAVVKIILGLIFRWSWSFNSLCQENRCCISVEDFGIEFSRNSIVGSTSSEVRCILVRIFSVSGTIFGFCLVGCSDHRPFVAYFLSAGKVGSEGYCFLVVFIFCAVDHG